MVRNPDEYVWPADEIHGVMPVEVEGVYFEYCACCGHLREGQLGETPGREFAVSPLVVLLVITGFMAAMSFVAWWWLPS